MPRPIAVLAAPLTAILAAVLAGEALLAWHSSARTVTTIRTVAAPPGPETADALGCPSTVHCGVSPMPLPDSLSAIRRWNSGAAVDAGTVVFDDRGTPVHSLITVEVGARHTAVTIAAQCVPHGARIANSVRADARTTVTAVTVGGRPGCSVVVTGALPAAVLSRLAHAPELQL